MKLLQIKIQGIAPLLMHNDTLANPLAPETLALKPLNAKRKKTEDDYRQIARMEWEAGLYFDPDAGPYLPARVLEAMIRKGAMATKMGKAAQAGIVVVDEVNPLQYEGPRTIEELYADKRFVNAQSMVIGKVRVMRCRPIFHLWACEFRVQYNEGVISADADIFRFIGTSGQLVGIGDYRPRYGRFELISHKAKAA